jgi:hypothetical protein
VDNFLKSKTVISVTEVHTTTLPGHVAAGEVASSRFALTSEMKGDIK